MPLIDRETVQRITDAADIVEVVGDYVHLVRRGANYMGLCPFHNERTPSFSVNKRKNFCFCFSCKQGGSPVNFIMKKEGLSYHEALLHLAKKYGIEVRQRELSEEERRQQSEREAMFVANEWAMLKFKDNLFNTEEGRLIGLSYFYEHREITQEACEAFKLGYAIDKGNAFTTEAKNAGLDISVLKKLGLVGESREGKTYDKYRGRVIFPIINTAGKVIGFGGRTLKNDKAKYINSPESEIYKKSNELYGIFQARTSIGKEDKCFLVEGYFDVIGMWQSGMKNVVASSGTALTDGQIALIHRFTDNITLIYDGDKAGIKAALRGVDMLLHHKMKVKVLLLPDGDDPDSFARKHTPEDFRKFVEANETDVINFKARVLINESGSDPQQRIIALQDMVTTLAHISDPISRDVYVQECSQVMHFPEETILKAVVKKRSELIEQWKREKTRKEFSAFSPDENSNPSHSSESVKSLTSTLNEAKKISDSSISQDIPDDAFFAGISSSQSSLTTLERGNSENSSYRANSLYPLERKIVEYVVKFGYLPFCSLDEDSEDIQDAVPPVDSESWWDVMDFVLNDLSEDNISITDPVLNKILIAMSDLRPVYKDARMKKEKEIEEDCRIMLKKGFEKISQRNLSVLEIEREEKFLESNVREHKRKEILDFIRHYPTRMLASHEDNEIRETATMLALEKHQLSNIFFRDNNVVESVEDQLSSLLPKALNELKSAILEQQIAKLRMEISNTTEESLVLELMQKIQDKMKFRALLAKDLGERVISPDSSRVTRR